MKLKDIYLVPLSYMVAFMLVMMLRPMMLRPMMLSALKKSKSHEVRQWAERSSELDFIFLMGFVFLIGFALGVFI
jgi:small neutral amino acid transporter SnatA (MarC family)